MDERLLSPMRLGRAVAMWLYLGTRTPPITVSLGRLLLYYRRPYAGRRWY